VIWRVRPELSHKPKAPPPPDVSPGEVYWVNIPQDQTVGHEQYDQRPYVVVSRLEVNRRGTVIGVPFTSVKDPSRLSELPPYWISIPFSELQVDWGAQVKAVMSVAKADQIRVLDRDRLGSKIGTLSRTALVSIQLGIQFALEIA
jgi:mRNA-degrading endonuclease toxin of MazEF toxin-antitoxin module